MDDPPGAVTAGRPGAVPPGRDTADAADSHERVPGGTAGPDRQARWQAAAQIRRDRPGWVVSWSDAAGQYRAWPLFRAPRGTIATAATPGEITAGSTRSSMPAAIPSSRRAEHDPPRQPGPAAPAARRTRIQCLFPREILNVTDQLAAPPTAAPAGRLEPDAIGVAQDTVIGMASAAPTVSAGLTLAALAAVSAYGGGPVILLCGAAMLIIANAYRRLNLWQANCGASFELAGRAISPYAGYFTGWLMIAAYITGAVSGVEVLGPSVLAVFGAATASTGADIVIAVAVTGVMLVIAVAGIRLSARVQVAMAVAEYAILIGLAAAGLAAVLGHHAGTFPVSSGWFSLHGIGGKGSLAGGLVAAVYIYSGWDGTVYVNEEVRHRRVNPGRAAMLAVALLTVIYVLAQAGLQGVVSPARLQAHSTDALVYAAQALAGTGGARVMALALALSVIAATGTSIILTARIIYGMASYRALPAALANVSARYATPVAASVLTGALVAGLTVVYFLATTVQGAFSDVVNLSGQLFAGFYILTALSTIVYYRHRVRASARDAFTLGVLPLTAAGFLGWVLWQYLQTAAAPQLWAIGGVAAAGLALMLTARHGLRSPFFALPREHDTPAPRRPAGPPPILLSTLTAEPILAALDSHTGKRAIFGITLTGYDQDGRALARMIISQKFLRNPDYDLRADVTAHFAAAGAHAVRMVDCTWIYK